MHAVVMQRLLVDDNTTTTMHITLYVHPVYVHVYFIFYGSKSPWSPQCMSRLIISSCHCNSIIKN